VIPDPAAGRLLRAYAVVAWTACAVVSCERGAAPAAAAGPRIVTAGGAITETVFALGAGARVVGVDTSSLYPPEVSKLPRVGYQRTLSAEGILALAPDLVVLSDEAGPPAVIEQLRRTGVRVMQTSGAKTIEEAAARITAIGAALDLPAAALATQVRREAHAARARVPDGGPSFVLVYARGAGTLMVAGEGAQGVAMVELAGGRNAVTGFSGFKPLSAEVLIAAAPEVIVVPSRGLATLGGEAGLLALPGVADTPAGRARRIVAFDDLLLLGFGPRLGPAIDELSSRLRAGARSAQAVARARPQRAPIVP
jgi:iron complex transport system substrate-binding protein